MKNLRVLCFLFFCFEVNAQPLADFLKIAAAHNPSLKAKFKMYEAALEKVNQVGALPDPTLDFGYFVSPIETRVGPQQVKIGFMQMFPWLGTLTAKEEVYANIAKSNWELFEAEKEYLFYQIKQVWYEMVELNQSIEIVDANLKILTSFESLATQKFETGTKTGMVDVLRIQMEIAELKNKQLLLAAHLKLKNSAFTNLLNWETAVPIVWPEQQEVLILLATTTTLNDRINRLNHELISLRLQQAAFKSAELVAMKQGMPRIGVGLNYFWVNERTAMAVPDNGKDAFMPMVSFTIPIARKKYKAQKKEAIFKGESVGFQIKNKQNQLNTALEMQWVNYSDARRRRVLYTAQNVKAKQALEIRVSSYTHSGKDFEELLSIQRMMLNYELQLLEAIKDQNVAVVTIESMY